MGKDEFNLIVYKYFELLDNSISVEEFEQWVYKSKELEAILNSDDYLYLVSLNYHSKFVIYEIEKIIHKYIDYGKFETIKLTSLLKRVLQKDEKTGEILREFYNMNCDGYYFLDDLGLGYGLSCEVPSNANSWKELDFKQKKDILDSFYPQLEYDIKRALDWIESEKIILTGKKNDLDQWQYIDNRTDEEKNSTIWFEVKQGPGAQVKKSRINLKNKWWKFWYKKE